MGVEANLRGACPVSCGVGRVVVRGTSGWRKRVGSASMRTLRNSRWGRIYPTSGRRSSDEAQLGQVRGGAKAAGSRRVGAQTLAAGAGAVPDAGADNGRRHRPGGEGTGMSVVSPDAPNRAWTWPGLCGLGSRLTAEAPKLGLRAWPILHTTTISCCADVKSAGGRKGRSQVHVIDRVGYCAGFNQG